MLEKKIKEIKTEKRRGEKKIESKERERKKQVKEASSEFVFSRIKSRQNWSKQN